MTKMRNEPDALPGTVVELEEGGKTMNTRRTTGHRVVRCAVAGGLVVAVSLLAAGCRGADPAPTPSQDPLSSPAKVETEPSPTPSQYDPVTAAKAAYTNYMDVQNAVGQDYLRGWDTKVMPLLIGGMAENRRQISQEYGEGQYYQVGEDKILYMKVTKHNEFEVIMDVCIDSSSVHIIGPDGASVHDGRPEPRLAVVTVVQLLVPENEQDPVGQGWWRVADSVTQTGAACSG